jgi:uncharacterized protein YkwD
MRQFRITTNNLDDDFDPFSFGDINNSNTNTETIEEVDPRTGRVTRTTRTVIKSGGGGRQQNITSKITNFGGFNDDDNDFFKKKLENFDGYENHHFTEEYDCGNGTNVKKRQVYYTINNKNNHFEDDDFEEIKNRFNKANMNDYSNDTQKKTNPSSRDFNKDPKKSKNTFDLQKFRDDCLNQHNAHRRNHRVNDLKVNSELQSIAQKYAEKIAKLDVMEHSDGNFNGEDMGENLYMQQGREMLGKMPADSWYDEIKCYNFNDDRKSTGVTGHFTQLVWKGSEEVGIGCAQSSDGSYYVVANYFPAGNFGGEYKKNVLPKK